MLFLALTLCGISGYRLWQKNSSDKNIQVEIEADEKAIALATRFGYSLPNAYKSLGSALKTLIEQTPNRRNRRKFEERLQFLRKSAAKAKSQMDDKTDPLRSDAFRL